MLNNFKFFIASCLACLTFSMPAFADFSMYRHGITCLHNGESFYTYTDINAVVHAIHKTPSDRFGVDFDTVGLLEIEVCNDATHIDLLGSTYTAPQQREMVSLRISFPAGSCRIFATWLATEQVSNETPTC